MFLSCWLLCFVFLCPFSLVLFFFFFNDTATTEIYTLSLHDALPILRQLPRHPERRRRGVVFPLVRSEEHTSELQSHSDLVCRLLLEKKKTNRQTPLASTNNTNITTSYNNESHT